MLRLFSKSKINLQNNESNNSLWQAAKAGDFAGVKKLLDEGADPNEGHYSTHIGATLNPKKNIRSFPIVYAAASGHFKIIKLLMERCKLTPQSLAVAIEMALFNDHKFIANYLLGKYKICSKLNIVDINEWDADGDTILHNIIYRVGHVRFTYKNEKDPSKNSKDSPSRSEYSELLEYNQEELQDLLNKINQFVQMGVDINAMNRNDKTPLLLAISKAGGNDNTTHRQEACNMQIYPPVIKRLLELGADVNKLTRCDFESPLSLAARVCNSEVVKLLLPRITKDDYKIISFDRKLEHIGQEPWYVKPMFAVFQNFNYQRDIRNEMINILRQLKEAGADFNYQPTKKYIDRSNLMMVNITTEKENLLEHAIRSIALSQGERATEDKDQKFEFDNAIAIIRYLLENGADPNQIEANGQSPLEFYQSYWFSRYTHFTSDEKALVLGLFVQHGYRYHQLQRAENNYNFSTQANRI